MKKPIYLIMLAGILVSTCQKEKLNPEIGIPTNSNILQVSGAEKVQFARVLSKAVYHEQAVREFLKREALKQFDNDYDVLYGLVKDNIVKDGLTFKEVLGIYANDENFIKDLEVKAPLLNILVPDLTMFTEFNAETWDISDAEVPVTALVGGDSQTFYGNGDEVFSLSLEEVPGFPCLIVKDNERVKPTQLLKVKGSTSYDYTFLDPVYDGRLKTKGAIDIDGRKYGYRDDQIISPSIIVQRAFDEFGTDPFYWQRDYIYFNLTKAQPQRGRFNEHVREYIDRIKVDPRILSTIIDHPNDPRLTSFEIKSNSKNPLSWAEIVRRLWTDGKFELRFFIYKGRKGEGAVPDERQENVSPQDLFSIRNIEHRIKKGGLFRRDLHTFSVKSINDLEGKWYAPRQGAGIQLEQWNIMEESVSMKIVVEEFDPGDIEERQITVNSKYVSSKNFKFDFGLGNIPKWIVKLDLSFGTSSQKEESRTEVVTWKTTHTSDKMGDVTFYFSDPVLRNQYYKHVPELKIYDGYAVSTGSVDIQLLPKPLR
ncbi:hypothetical protein [Sphingobacterium deserti]|uniref:Uncharacterized protein n=1 Tax=Sphingobacterium deserti TaxID=1229276 RepID=A0A0B8T5I8_9SPHI|nr:hypothetical protein [Sphingobacterium deserti]KGE15853.1 hypothetical protein DI53_0406 [Sphingobacterium deserti]